MPPQYDQLKNEVMQFLIQAEWVQQEAEDRDVKVSDAEVKKSFDEQKKQAFPKEADYKKFLKDSGMTEEDILFRVKLDQLQTKLTQKVTKDKVKIIEHRHHRLLREEQEALRPARAPRPERRAHQDQGQGRRGQGGARGRQELQGVAKKYSIDEASKAQGGKLPDLAKGQQEPALDTAVFTAKKGKVYGPVKTQFGYYVFEVAKVKTASQQSLEQAKDTIRNLLRTQREQKALDSFVKDFREKYKERRSAPTTSAWPSARTLRRAAPGPLRAARLRAALRRARAPQGAAPQGPRLRVRSAGRGAPGRCPAGCGSAGRAAGRGATPQTPTPAAHSRQTSTSR